MNKTICSIALAGILTLGSCSTSKISHKASLQDISGEWVIEKVNGAKVPESKMQNEPFIGFNIETGSMYGSAGCNRIMGTFDKDSAPGAISIEYPASTRMLCPDMAIEDLVLPALGNVKGYKLNNKNTLSLLNSEGDVIFTLKKRK